MRQIRTMGGQGGASGGAGGTTDSTTPSHMQFLAALDAENARLQMEMQALGMPGGGMGFPMGNPYMTYPSQTYAPNSSGFFNATAAGGLPPPAGYTLPHHPQQMQQPFLAETQGSSQGDMFQTGQLGRTGSMPKMVQSEDSRRDEELKNLEFEMKRLQLEQELSEMREKVQIERQTKESDHKHQQWLAEKKREMEMLTVEREVARKKQLVELQKMSLTTMKDGTSSRVGEVRDFFFSVQFRFQETMKYQRADLIRDNLYL